MNQERWYQIKRSFEEANQKSGPARVAFLEQLRERDHDLFQEIESLLSASEDSGEFMELPAEILQSGSRFTSDWKPLSQATKIALVVLVLLIVSVLVVAALI